MTIISYNGEEVEVGNLSDRATPEQKRAALFKARPDAEIAYKKFVASKQPKQKSLPETPIKNVEQMVADDVKRIQSGKKPISKREEPGRSKLEDILGLHPRNNPNPERGRMALEKFHDALRNIGAGGANSLFNAAQGARDLMSINNPNLAGRTQMPDFNKMFGVKEPVEGIQKIPEMAAGFAIPHLGVASRLRAAPALARGLASAAEQGAIQGGHGYLFNPENRSGAAKKQGGIAAGTDLALSALTSRHPASQLARQVIPRALGSVGGYEAGELAELPLPMKLSMGLGGYMAGPAAMSLLPKLIGRNTHAEGYAYDVAQAMKGMKPGQLEEIEQASQRMGTYLTPGEITQDPILIAKEAKAGVTKKNVQLKHKHENARLANEEKINREFSEGVYNPEKHKGEMEAAFDKSKDQKIPNDKLPEGYDDIYARAIRMAKKNPELSAELAKAKPGTIGKYDVIRRALDKMLKAEKGSKYNLNNARKQLSNSLKDFSDDYRQAMSFSEKEKVVNSLEKLANKETLHGKKFFEAIEGNKEFKNMLLHTRDVKGAEQFLTDARKIYKLRKSVDTNSLAKKLTDSGIPTSKAEAKSFIDRMFKGKSDKAMIDLMYDPNAMQKVHKILEMTDQEKILVELSKVLSREKGNQLSRESK